MGGQQARSTGKKGRGVGQGQNSQEGEERTKVFRRAFGTPENPQARGGVHQ